MELRRPQLQDKIAILEMVSEFQQTADSMDGYFNAMDLDYEIWLEQLALAEIGLGFADDFVPYIQYVSFSETGRALGFLNLRLRLNAKLEQQGGHIGYSIRPSERGKGYAKMQLGLGLQEAAKKNINSVLLTCSTSNRASRHIILSQGGILYDCSHGVERYKVAVSEICDDLRR